MCVQRCGYRFVSCMQPSTNVSLTLLRKECMLKYDSNLLDAVMCFPVVQGGYIRQKLLELQLEEPKTSGAQ